MEAMNLAMASAVNGGAAQEGMAPNTTSTGMHLDSSKNQLILFIYTFRKYMRWPLIALNAFFILLELLMG